LLTKHAEQRDTIGFAVQTVIFVLLLNIIVSSIYTECMARCLMPLLMFGRSWV